LREENDFFVKQISDDFEELTFLRSMAERLSLGEGNDDIHQFIFDLVPTLGAAVHAEALYFVEGSAAWVGGILTAWHSCRSGIEPHPEFVIRQLVERYAAAADVQPVIRNRFAASSEGREFTAVREFLLVAVEGSTGHLGYFLGINRDLGSDEFIAQAPQWHLSQYEFGTSEASLLRTAGAMLTSHANNLALFRERETLLISVVRSLVSAIEAKDRYTCGHSERVALYGKRLAEELGYDEKAAQRLYLTGLLHDIGKIAVSDAVLNKPGRLTDEEFAEIKRHPDEGWVILNELQQLSYVLPGVLHHHERTDGKGYPDGLVSDGIPLDGRILAVADAYDAMTSNRAYRQGMSQEKAEAILREGAGTQWDADVIDAFFDVVDDIIALRNSYQPRQRPERKPGSLAASAK
jgi:HD-GYP domain-containing protein (c-di-GMP phosphodiesterase class II)